MSDTITYAPRAAYDRATARPMPDPAPVTSATRPLSPSCLVVSMILPSIRRKNCFPRGSSARRRMPRSIRALPFAIRKGAAVIGGAFSPP